MSFVACKLPAGLRIDHMGEVIVLHGANIGEDLENVSRNGRPNDNQLRSYGFGLTELDDKKTEAFEAWKSAVTYKEGKKEAGKLAEPFAALENGSIQGPFKSIDDARKEVATLHSAVTTGTEGVDPDKEQGQVKIEDATDDGGKAKVARR